MISFIVPAHNEQGGIGRALQAIHASAQVIGRPYEIIVVDDSSTDETAGVAREHNATVLPVSHRQIAATRNSGARAAQGERFFFVDADTIISPGVLASALRSLDKGAAGGGAPARFEADAPLYARLLLLWLGLGMRVAGISGGAFMFCTRDAFRAIGGFDERLFGAEDAAMSWALKREGRFVILWKYVSTSGRRMRGFRGLAMVTILIRMAFLPSTLKRRAPVEHIWYDSGKGLMMPPISVRVLPGAGQKSRIEEAVHLIKGPNFIPPARLEFDSDALAYRFCTWLLIISMYFAISCAVFRMVCV